MWKNIFFWILLLIGSIWGYGWVFWSSFVFGVDIEYMGTLSEDVYLDDTNLSKTVVVYKANVNLSDYSVLSTCAMSSRFIDRYKGIYFFELNFQNVTDCRDTDISLYNEGVSVWSDTTKIRLISYSDILQKYLDYPDQELEFLSGGLSIDMNKNEIYNNYRGKDRITHYRYMLGQRKYQSAVYIKNIIDSILEARTIPYISPVPNDSISAHLSRIPNAARNYRAAYTDGIHHGWDISAALWAPTVALDDGIIVRVVADFDRRKFDDIRYGSDLSEEDKLKNLDILRGKQVWLKTMKGEVIFYSHLDDIAKGIAEGVYVTKNTELWTIGSTGVPGEDYKDYHLHFAIMENPYKIVNAGNYSFLDYMAWDWKLRGLSASEVIEKQKDIFE